MRPIETETLCPGVLFDYIPTEDYKNASFGVGFKYKVRRGCSSADKILSRLLVRTSGDYPTHTLFSRRLEELYLTDLTSQTVRRGDFRATLFQTELLDEPFVDDIPDFTREVMTTVAGAILRPAAGSEGFFADDEIEREKRALLDQIRSIKNSKSAYAQKRIAEITADPARYDVPEYGTEREIGETDAALLRRRYREMLYRSEVRFVYAGSAPKEKIRALILDLFSNLLKERKPLTGRCSFPRRAPHVPILRVTEETDGKQAILALSYRIPIGYGEGGHETVSMLTTVLSDAPMALLFSEVREKGGYCYSIRCGVRLEKRELVVLCGIAPGSEKAVERAVSRVFSTVRRGQTDPGLIGASLSYCKTALVSIWENVDETVMHVLMRRLFDLSIDPDQLTERLAAVTAEELAALTRGIRPDAVFLLTPKGGVTNG